MIDPDYIVIRPASDLPSGFLPNRLDGMWFDGNEVPWSSAPYGPNDAVAVATGRFEVRNDGAIAEVYEIRV